MLAIQLTLSEKGKRQDVSCRLDFADQQWSMSRPSGRWNDVVFSTKGKFEVRDNGVIWIWDGPTSRPNSHNTMIIRNAPRSQRDVRHRSGVCRIYKARDPSMNNRLVSWKVTSRIAMSFDSSKVLSPIRKRMMDVCDAKLPKGIKYNYFAGQPKNDGAGVTNCNIFVGLILSYINPNRIKMMKRIAGEPFAMPRFQWDKYAQKIDRLKSPLQSTWIPFSSGKRPRPGDIYLLEVLKDKGKLKKGQTQHIGIIEDATGNVWKTIDGGQKAVEGQPSYA